MIRIDSNIHKLDIIAELIQISNRINAKATLVSYHLIITLTVVQKRKVIMQNIWYAKPISSISAVQCMNNIDWCIPSHNLLTSHRK